MNHTLAGALVSLAAFVAGCGGAQPTPEGSSAPDASAVKPRPARCSNTVPTRFVDGAPGAIATSVTTANQTGGGLSNVTLVATDEFVDEVVTDGTTLYWTLRGASDGAIISAPIAAGAPTLVVDETGEGSPSHLAVRGQRLFWLEVASSADSSDIQPGVSQLARVVTANLDGSNLRTLTGFEMVNDVAFDDDAAYVAEEGNLVRIDGASGARQALVGTAATTVGVDATNVYFLTMTLFGSVPKSGGVVTTLATTASLGSAYTSVGAIAATGSSVYWWASWIPVGDKLVYATPGGGTALNVGVAPDDGIVEYLRPQGPWIYSTVSNVDPPSIYRWSPQGGPMSLVVPLYEPAGVWPPGYDGTESSGGFAVDATNVYWGGFDDLLNPAVFCVAH
jgi:hypothetical protein